jgi:hypothetical protein
VAKLAKVAPVQVSKAHAQSLKLPWWEWFIINVEKLSPSLNRVKPEESLVEARCGSDVQIDPQRHPIPSLILIRT